jgi:hypothetical protein
MLYCRYIYWETGEIVGRNARGRADREVAKSIALGLPDVELASHHGKLDIRVRNRVFATFPAETKVVQLRCSGPELEALVTEEPDTFSRVHGRPWLQVSLDEVDRERLEKLMIRAWFEAAPPALRSMYGERLGVRR